MRLKSFTAKSVPEAMRKVRDQLGPDAVILSSHTDPCGLVKVTAALDGQPDAGGAMADFSDSLRAIDDLSETLDYHRVPPGLADRLIAAASSITTDDATMALAAALDAEIAFAPLNKRHAERPLLLAGPPGAGKTATAAKLCAWARLLELEATIISMDDVKAGAAAQVGAYATALGAQLDQASDARDLQHRLKDVAPGGFVVIDTVGTNPFDANEQAQLAELAKAASAPITLVLPAGGDTMETAEIALAFQASGARNLIATKLDATRRLGGVLSAAHAAGLALVAGGTAPSIGNGLITINPVSLARQMRPAPAEATPIANSGNRPAGTKASGTKG